MTDKFLSSENSEEIEALLGRIDNPGTRENVRVEAREALEKIIEEELRKKGLLQ